MDLEQLKTALDVSRHGGFAATARRRGVDPSVVSRAVAALEAELGFRLFQRSTRRLSLTEAGERYLSRVDGILEALEAAAEEAQGLAAAPTGVLRLSCSVAFGQARVAPLLSPFRAAFPRLGLELISTDQRLDLVAERIDLALRLGPEPGGDVIAAKLATVSYRLCASPAYLAAAPPLARPEDLAEHACLLLDRPEFRTAWRFERAGAPARDVAVRGDLVFSSPLALLAAAEAGLGPALLADWLCEAPIAAGRLSPLLPAWRASVREAPSAIWAIYPSRSFLPAKTRAAVDFFRGAFRRRGSG